MQIYPTVVGLYPTGTYGERNERATAAQKAQDRERLLKAIESAGLGTAPPTSRRYTEVPSGDEYHAPSKGKEPNFD